ncbi:TetR/AcrR family transcriptional regulator [Tsukamurella soli]|uniref:TetR/AcrR family transcriptional regulator n=1 Tax=Tsukamurella soli TaxID=644556 RepID=A0ABP8JTI9_9ACTN
MSRNEELNERPLDGRVTRWDDHKAQRREAILEAAVEAVAEGGADISVQDIALRAAVPRSVVYRIFADRADLDEQLRLRILGDLIGRLTPTLDPRGTIAEAIEFAVDTYVRWIVEYPRLHQFLSIGSRARRTVGARAVIETKAEIALRVTAIAAEVLRANGADTGVAESLAFGLIGLVDATVNRWLANPGHSIDAAGLAAFLRTSIWSVVQGTAAQAGIALEPTMQVVAVTDAR